MATMQLIEYEDAPQEVKVVYDDIRKSRGSEFINNFWKGLANNPEQLKSTWENLKTVMGEGEIDPLVKEFIYIAVSVANSCSYCIHSHTAAAKKKGMTEQQHAELLSVIGMANHTNGLATTMQIDVDESFLQ
ncbi:MAG: carboxymuconolactone decarboxylase family protein [Pseudomonadota bacterium]|nr:carboxymuconolactone decarboxylase family protein [Pseudomonadota bacterium]